VSAPNSLKALAAQMHVLCLEQITNAFATLDLAAVRRRSEFRYPHILLQPPVQQKCICGR
jgi:hypothetical protein